MGNMAILDPKFQNHLGSHLNVFIWLRLVELDNQSHPPRKKKKFQGLTYMHGNLLYRAFLEIDQDFKIVSIYSSTSAL